MELIANTVTELQEAGRVISSAKIVCEQVMANYEMKVSEKKVRQVLKKDCQLSFIKAKKLAPQANS